MKKLVLKIGIFMMIVGAVSAHVTWGGPSITLMRTVVFGG